MGLIQRFLNNSKSGASELFTVYRHIFTVETRIISR